MKYVITLLVVLGFTALASDKMIHSNSFDWRDFKIEPRGSLENKMVIEGASDGFEHLEISLINIGVGDTFVIPSENNGLESLVIMKSGTSRQVTSKAIKVMGAGSVSLIMPGDKLSILNTGQSVVTIYLMAWDARQPLGSELLQSKGVVSSHLINWNDVEFIESEKGGRRNLIRESTAMLREFEMHVTTLKEGMRSHLPHTHIDEEIILVRQGDVEEYIDGELHRVGQGSFIFLRSMVPHGIRNIGRGPAEYYAFKWAPRQ